MFIREKVKTLAALGSASAGLWMLVAVHITDDLGQCESATVADISSERLIGFQPCHSNEQISWKAWVSGNSLSFQFHFFDLMELLYGGETDGRFSGTGS
ncbi:hypothetical protein [Salinimonas chungwhensis]|uniref:hypothetical protein n=1 Tax=Salinimonas chungwhensis TaxID=265425 RepID=UPI00037B7946|nr:hypothetical protein [Salinimonas chungwhensis]